MSPEAPPSASARGSPSAALGPGELDDIVRMMHSVVLREGAAPDARRRTTPVGREMARAILNLRGAELGARGLARDEAANGALRYLFRDVAARLAGVWRDEVASAEPERSPLWAMRAAPAAPGAPALEDIYEALGVNDYSDPLEPKLRDVGAIYDRFLAAHPGDEESVGWLSNEIAQAARDAAAAVRARVHTEIGGSFPAALKARALRAMRLDAYEAAIARVGALATSLAVGAIYTPTARTDAPDAMEAAVRDVAKAARASLAIARDAGAFARAVFGDVGGREGEGGARA